MSAIREFRLRGPGFWVDVRLYQLNGRWLASADSPGGPTLRTGYSPLAALTEALEPFEGVCRPAPRVRTGGHSIQQAVPGLVEADYAFT